MPDSESPPSAVVWDDDGAPRSRRHHDIYFSADDGLAESRAVFLSGCGFPQTWAGRPRFAVGELGFGAGLNIAALLDLWDRTRTAGARLAVFTVESAPLTAAEAARALARWPEISRPASLLTARWPDGARGFHRIDLPELAATVDVAIMEAADALAAWDGRADAWFLDGFAPSLNPDIWRPEVLNLVASRSAPGARAATYTVAGAVRRTLAGAGFSVTRAPGHGRKRERLEARLAGAAAIAQASPRVAIVGAGVAGASLRRAFAALGLEATVFDAVGPGAGGSGALAALMAPRLDAGLGVAAALFAQASRRAAALYDAVEGAVIAGGAVQLPTGAKDPGRFAAIAGSDLFARGTLRRLTANEAGARLGEPAGAGLLMAGARVIRPSAILRAWLGEVARARVEAVKRSSGGAWRLIADGGGVVAEADVVCLAAGMGSVDLAPGLALTPVRGQASFTEGVDWNSAAVFGAYVIPTGEGVLFGATHDRDDGDAGVRPGDRQRNLDAVAAALPSLAARLTAAPSGDWSAVRATTGDYLPLAGLIHGAEPGLVVLTGLGSRGFCLAPLLAEHLAAGILGAPSPLPRDMAALVDPGRFAARAARKGRPRPRTHA